MCNSIVFGTTGGPKTAFFSVFSVQILYSFLESTREALIAHGFIAGLKAKTTGGETKSIFQNLEIKTANLRTSQSEAANRFAVDSVRHSTFRKFAEGQREMVGAKISNMPGHRPEKGANLHSSEKAAEQLNVSERTVKTAKKTQTVSNRFRNHSLLILLRRYFLNKSHFETVTAGVTFALPHSTFTHCKHIASTLQHEINKCVTL